MWRLLILLPVHLILFLRWIIFLIHNSDINITFSTISECKCSVNVWRLFLTCAVLVVRSSIALASTDCDSFSSPQVFCHSIYFMKFKISFIITSWRANDMFKKHLSVLFTINGLNIEIESQCKLPARVPSLI
jgi:hypothetical protein